ncbi:MAG TPA: histidine phosphatase family protein [Actinomycetota bacterium]|nr:histidine phosphatase family protein [Actinomycetota bacterium]
MTLLYLVRHAKSSWDDLALADRDRPLSARGERSAATLAEYLEVSFEGGAPRPGLVLCSPARRTLDTLETLRPVLGSATIAVEEELYGATSGELLRRLRRIPGKTSAAMVIGHNPALQELAIMLARASDDLRRLHEKFPTGALAALRTHGAWKELGAEPAELEDFVAPREMQD